MFLWLIPVNHDFTTTVGIFAVNIIAGGMIGSLDGVITSDSDILLNFLIDVIALVSGATDSSQVSYEFFDRPYFVMKI